MSQYPGGQPPPPPQDPYYGQPPADPYAAAPPQPGDPYYGQPPGGDAYAPPQDPYYGQPPSGDNYAQQQAYYAQQQAWAAQQQPPKPRRRGGSGTAIFGLLLVIVGAWILFGDQLDIDLDFSAVWPIAVVVLGVIMVVASVLPSRDSQDG